MGHIPVAKASPIRREWQFPKRGLAIALVLIGMFAVGGVILATAWPTDPPPAGTVVVSTQTVSSLEVGKPIRLSTFWLVKTPDGTLLALAHRDPRNGCAVPWRPNFMFDGKLGWFRDPCHGSTYDAYGNKVFGPSPRDMDHYDLSIRSGQAYVDTSRIICSDGSFPCVIALPLPNQS